MKPSETPAAHWSLDQWLRWQESLHAREIELGLERVTEVGQRLGVLRSAALTLTVAGTNGKGSTATLLALAARAAGRRTGLYTSPHLLHYNERVAVDGTPVTDAQLCGAFTAVEAARAGTPLTYFEFGTLAALWLFRDSAVDVQVLEVGLGGRLDAVNAVDADAAAVTSVGVDHTDWLGPDRESIGREKAGVYRAGRPAVCADPQPPQSLLQHAADIGADLRLLDRDFHYQDQGKTWDWQGRETRWRGLPRPGMAGPVQLRNAAAALAVLEAVQPRLGMTQPALHRALAELQLPGRFQQHGNLVLDVAHNVEAAEVLAANLRATPVPGHTHLVLGMFADKPVEAFCSVLAEQVADVYAAPLPPPRGLTADALAACIAGIWPGVQSYSSVAAALQAARAACAQGDRVLVTGSFLTVAAALEQLGE